MSLLCIEMMSKHYGVLLSFPSIDLLQRWWMGDAHSNPGKHAQNFESWWSSWSSLMLMNVLGDDSSLGLCLFVKRLNVVPLHMVISLNVSVQYPSASLFLSSCCYNFNSRFYWFPMDRMQRACFVLFFCNNFMTYLILVLHEKLYTSSIYYGRFYRRIEQEKRLSKNKTLDLVYLTKRSNSLRRQ